MVIYNNLIIKHKKKSMKKPKFSQKKLIHSTIATYSNQAVDAIAQGRAGAGVI